MNSENKKKKFFELNKRKEAEELLNNIWYRYDKQNTGILPKKMSLKLLEDISNLAEDKEMLKFKNQILAFLDADGDGKLSKRELISLLCSD